MSTFVFRMPDLGEGTVSAEIVAWHVKPGDMVAEGQTIADASTDKAVVEIPAPVAGRVVKLAAEAGMTVPVGAEFIVFERLDAPGERTAIGEPAPDERESAQVTAPLGAAAHSAESPRTRPMASPATRRRAHEAGLDLTRIQGSGRGGRILRQDLDAALAREEIRVIGVRRLIAERMSAAKRNIPHFSYVEEVDVTELEALREHLNAAEAQGPRLTLLPFIIAALVRTLPEFPQCNAHYDAEREVIVRHRAVHVGIATQTPDGLKVPVIRHAEGLGLRELAREIRRVSEAAAARAMIGSIVSSLAPCRCDRLHRLPARLFALPARFGADAAVLVHLRVACALLAACPAGLGAQLERHPEDRLIAARAPRGEGARGRAEVRTVEVEPDALPQRRHLVFGEAGICAHRAALRTVIAGLDAADQDVVRTAPNVRVGRDHLFDTHGSSPSGSGDGVRRPLVFPAGAVDRRGGG